jgi:Cyclic nucleotide-binding domain
MRGGSAVAALRSVCKNGTVLRVLVAYASFSIGEFGIWITLLVYAYEKYGATGATVIVLAQLLPSALFAPLTRPSQAALFPSIVRTAAELTTANAVSAWIDGLGSLLGPASAGLAIAWAGVAAGVAVAAGLNAVAVILVAGRLGLGPQGAGTDAAEDAAAEVPLLAGLRSALAQPATRLLLALTALYYTLVGAIDVLCVVLAVSLLHTGGGSAGYLNAAVGGGATVAGALTLTLAGRPRLASLAALSLLIAVAALTLIGALPSEADSIFLLAVVGAVGTVFLAASRILLQRMAPTDATGAAFAAMEGVMSFGLALGAVVVRVGIAAGGLRGGFFAPAILGIGVILVAATRLRAVDAAVPVPQVEIRLLRSIPIFAPLPSPALEGVAKALTEVAVPPGTVVVAEGDPGDLFYAVADGRLAVTRAGRPLRTLSRGSGFGEIALLASTPRTATVTALTSSLLYSLDKGSFLRAVTGHQAARAAAKHAMRGYDDPGLADVTDCQPAPGAAGWPDDQGPQSQVD